VPVLDALAGRRVALLQGPAGPFFCKLAKLLRERRATVVKVNFNAGDDLFYRGPEVVRFRGPFEAWPGFFERLVGERGIEAIVVFGDTRPLHRMAIEASARLGVRPFVIDEGYLRPDFVSFEEGGVLSRSSMPRDPEFYRELAIEPLPEPRSVGDALTPAALYTVAYASSHALLGWRYPHYRHHRDIRPLPQALCWARGGVRRALHDRRDRELDRRIAAGDTPPFYLVPLQVHLDAAVRDSGFDDIGEFIATTVRSFARHAPGESLLLVKDHPMGRPYRDYSQLLARLGAEHGVSERLKYVDVIHLPTALRRARGTVVINSTVGLSSIHHGTPVKCLGSAVYDLPGLTFQGSLDEFWGDPGQVDADLYERFRWWLRTHTQINGSVWKDLWP
jgi:capsule polysaccharide modification protein KpsS